MLAFLDRLDERRRLATAFDRPETSLTCVYGRRRCGKSRLLLEVLPSDRGVYHVADEREPALQRSDLARSMAALAPGFDEALYPGWGNLFEAWWRAAPDGAVLVLDEFPYLVAGSPELPSILQRMVDRKGPPARHLAICGSSQRMMQGLVLDARAPLYGRAREIIALGPLPPDQLRPALALGSGFEALEAWALWGGVPRYWELAAEHGSAWAALEHLVLSPHGPLHREPERLLLDDMREVAQAASVLALVARGCHRLSEVAARLGRPATALGRPLERLSSIGLVTREVPFGSRVKPGGKSRYRVTDPFVAFWFTHVEPNLSLLESGRVGPVLASIRHELRGHVAAVWESLVRVHAPRLLDGRGPWREGHRWWGAGLDGRPLEVDLVAESFDGKRLLVGEATLGTDPPDVKRSAALLPFAASYREVVTVPCPAAAHRKRGLVTAEDVFPAR